VEEREKTAKGDGTQRRCGRCGGPTTAAGPLCGSCAAAPVIDLRSAAHQLDLSALPAETAETGAGGGEGTSGGEGTRGTGGAAAPSLPAVAPTASERAQQPWPVKPPAPHRPIFAARRWSEQVNAPLPYDEIAKLELPWPVHARRTPLMPYEDLKLEPLRAAEGSAAVPNLRDAKGIADRRGIRRALRKAFFERIRETPDYVLLHNMIVPQDRSPWLDRLTPTLRRSLAPHVVVTPNGIWLLRTLTGERVKTHWSGMFLPDHRIVVDGMDRTSRSTALQRNMADLSAAIGRQHLVRGAVALLGIEWEAPAKEIALRDAFAADGDLVLAHLARPGSYDVDAGVAALRDRFHFARTWPTNRGRP
jgi:hypothetical protein